MNRILSCLLLALVMAAQTTQASSQFESVEVLAGRLAVSEMQTPQARAQFEPGANPGLNPASPLSPIWQPTYDSPREDRQPFSEEDRKNNRDVCFTLFVVFLGLCLALLIIAAVMPRRWW